MSRDTRREIGGGRWHRARVSGKESHYFGGGRAILYRETPFDWASAVEERPKGEFRPSASFSWDLCSLFKELTQNILHFALDLLDAR